MHRAECGTPIPETELDPEAYIVAQVDPTDHALAAIASILDMPESRRENLKARGHGATARRRSAHPHGACTDRGPRLRQASVPARWPRSASSGRCASTMATIMSTRPSARIRARSSSGPHVAEAAIQLVDDRESDARRRFEQLRERDDRTRRRSDLEPTRTAAGHQPSRGFCRRVIAAAPENPSWQDRHRHGAGCRRPS